MKQNLRGTSVTVHLAQLDQNWRHLQAQLPAASKLLAIVKANAYGHGTFEIAQHCDQLGSAGAGVADFQEALNLRKEGYKNLILCMGPLLPETVSIAAKENVVLSVSSLDELERFSSSAKKTKNSPQIHLQVETGMNRFGLPFQDWEDALSKMSGCKEAIVGIYSHLAESENQDPSFTKSQFQKFNEAIAAFESALGKRLIRHLENSGAILSKGFTHYDWGRPGIALYGYPSSSTPSIKPILRWTAPIVQIKRIASGETVGYNRRFKAKQPMNVATIAVGYGDGYLRGYQTVGVGFKGTRLETLGTISMDYLTLHLPDSVEANVGEEVTLLGPPSTGGPDAVELAQAIRTIPYEVLTGISQRVRRVYSTA